jgi:hypothetical protein
MKVGLIGYDPGACRMACFVTAFIS